MKQLDLSWFWLRDVLDQGAISPTYVPTGDMTADLLTKALPRLKVEQFCQEMGLAALRGSLLVGRVAQSGGSVEHANCTLIVLSHIVAHCCYVSLLLRRPIDPASPMSVPFSF